MNEESSANEPAENTVAKLLIDQPSDFRFHAAYLVYSEAWDKAISSEIKLKLNDIVSALSCEKTDYEMFYREISRYRVELSRENLSARKKTYIETQRKRDWRKRQERDSRNKRHGR
jgi:hypothetical protein